LKKQQKINSTIEKKKKFPTNKPTVAALLSAVYEKNPPKIKTPEKSVDVVSPAPPLSLPPPIPVPQDSIDVPIVDKALPTADPSLLIAKNKKQDEQKINAIGLSLVKKSSALKSNNKLKDYFKTSDDSFFSNKNNTICNLKTFNATESSSLLLADQSTELSTSIGSNLSLLSEISQINNSQYHMLDEELLFKKKSLKINKKLNRELMLQEKKLKKKNKLLEALATKSLKQKKKKSLKNEEETNHLVFEIVGDDGFYVQSKDINSKFFHNLIILCSA